MCTTRASVRAFAPRYPKVKDEGWWLLLGDAAAGRLLALRRVSVSLQASVRLTVPEEQAHALAGQPLVVYCMSDSYMGLDVAVQVQPKGGPWPLAVALECAAVEAVVPRLDGDADDDQVEESLELAAGVVVDGHHAPDLAEVVASLPGEDDDFWDPA